MYPSWSAGSTRSNSRPMTQRRSSYLPRPPRLLTLIFRLANNYHSGHLAKAPTRLSTRVIKTTSTAATLIRKGTLSLGAEAVRPPPNQTKQDTEKKHHADVSG